MNDTVQQAYPGPKILNIGGPGSGKTFALHTLVLAGLEVFILATDNGIETIGQFKNKVPGWTDEHDTKIHFHYFPPAPGDWSSLRASGQALNTFNNDSLQKMEDSNKSKHTHLLQMIDNCANFVCTNPKHPGCRGQHHGNAADWGNDKCLVLDNTSGLNYMARLLGCGQKPIISQPDWGKIMDYEERFLTMFFGVNCPAVCIGHIDREIDEVSGGMVKAIGLLGRKLAPKIPRLVSDCILSWREGSTRYWSTADSSAPDLKTRNLTEGDKLPPDYRPLFENWRKSSLLIPASPAQVS